MIVIGLYNSECGELVLGSVGDRLCMCDWLARRNRKSIDARLCRLLGCGMTEGSSPVIEQARQELDEYFRGERRVFSVPLLFAGTDFQKRVWQALTEIPYGTTISYSELAERLGMPSAVRAVANANGANAISLFAPCHRVIGSNGKLTGYAGGLEAKRYLLRREGTVLTR